MSNRTFVGGLVVCVALMLVFGGVIALLNRGTNRPEGAAEDWLTAISDTTRKGVEADATRRADKLGAPELARGVLHPFAEEIDRKAGFNDLEVGKAARMDPARDDKVLVAFRVSARRPNDETIELSGVLRLAKHEEDWTVTALDVVDPAKFDLPALPSDGGPPPSSAPATLWLGALVGAALVGLVTSALVRVAGRAPAEAAAA
ncbi:MAG TPA: hypothetical protein VMZ22_00280 [Acidimicrobiales bacterium]|nr:hypothetical protein [Acidimicrobiales bacterium]